MSEPTGYDLPPELTVACDGPVRIVTLNRPQELNAVNARLHWALETSLPTWSAGPQRRGHVLVVLA